jgi:lysophospholipase L1-like esterase
VGPAISLLAAMTLAFLALGGPGSGRSAMQEPSDSRDPISAAADGPTSSSPSAQRDTSAPSSPADIPAPVARAVPARAGSTPPTVLGQGPVPRANRHEAPVLAEVEPAAVSRLGPGAKAVFLGDSFTSGWSGAGIGSHGWPALVGADRSWTIVNLAVAGTGYMNPGWTHQTIGSQVDAAVRQKPQVVVIAGGHNDSHWAATTTSKEAVQVIDGLHAALPDAVIVIIAPIWQDGSPPTRCLVLRDALRREAKAIGAVFVDPLSDRWFAGTSHRFIGPDGLHPTNAGHAWMATRILADLAGI